MRARATGGRTAGGTLDGVAPTPALDADRSRFHPSNQQADGAGSRWTPATAVRVTVAWREADATWWRAFKST